MIDDEAVVEIDDRAIPKEARPYQGHRAGVVTRTLAGAVDVAIVALVVAGCYTAWAVLLFSFDPSSFRWPEPGLGVLFVIGIVLFAVYQGASWWAVGRTYGNQVMGLRVVNLRGGRLRLPTALLRGALCTVFPVGLYWCVVSRANRSVADVLLRTSVIYDWQVRPRTRRSTTD